MGQAIFETLFDVLYLVSVLTVGIIMLRHHSGRSLVKKFGIMAVVLGAGDAFHLIPRAYALWTTGMEANAAALGIGKLITSITMTVFYIILYYIWRERYAVAGRKGLTITIWSLAVARIALCLLPQNDWLAYHQPLEFDILRNLPFAAMGIILIVLFYQEARRAADSDFRWMWLAVTLSFLFYVPVVLWSGVWPAIGMLMIPKTLAYVWIVWMGWRVYSAKPKEV